MCKSIIDFVFLSLRPWHLTVYSHFTSQTGLRPRTGLGPQHAFTIWAEVTAARCFCCNTFFFSLPKSLQLPDTDCCEAVKDCNNQPATKKNASKRKQTKSRAPHILKLKSLKDHLQKDVNSFKSTVSRILSVFPLSEYVKRYQRVSNSKARFYLNKNSRTYFIQRKLKSVGRHRLKDKTVFITVSSSVTIVLATFSCSTTPVSLENTSMYHL